MRLRLLVVVALFSMAMGPFEKNHPLVDEGQRDYEHGDYEHALEKFDAAEKQLPGNATVEFNRGVTLHKLDKQEDALSTLNRALDLDTKGELKEKIHYNLGNVYAAMEKKKEAIAEYRKALKLDPRDEQARHNLEVLLRDLKPPQNQGPDGGTPDGGKSDGGSDGGTDAGRPDGGPDGGDGGSGDAGRGDAGSDAGMDGGNDGGSDGGSKGDGGQGDGGRGDGGQGEQTKPGDAGQSGDQKADGGQDGGADALDAGESEAEAEFRDGGVSMSRMQAESLLDSFKHSEKNIQPWRFQKDRDKVKRANGKDW
ncbi:MAG: tetratricopeptide repeat protein [Myxococcaceae bacterium]